MALAKGLVSFLFILTGFGALANQLIGNPNLALKTGIMQTETSVRVGVLVLNKGQQGNVVAMLESTSCSTVEFRPTVSKMNLGQGQYGRAVFALSGVAQKGCVFRGYIHSEGNPSAINTFEVKVE